MGVIPRNWLITGGCGFVGSRLVLYLLKHYPKVSIRVLDNLSVGRKDDLEGYLRKIELITGDIRNYNACLKSCEGMDVVVHLAASTGVPFSIKNPDKDMQTNVLGTFNMLQASKLKNVKKFIFASSGAVIGSVTPPISEVKLPSPVSPYGAGKLAGEAYCLSFAHAYGLKTVILRFGNVYGPGSRNKNSVVAKFFKDALIKEKISIYGDGSQTRDFIYVEDLLSAIILSVRAKITGEIFQIASGREVSILQIAKSVKKIIESSAAGQAKIIFSDSQAVGVKNFFSCIKKAEKMLGFRPRFSLNEGLMKTAAYFNKNCYEFKKTS